MPSPAPPSSSAPSPGPPAPTALANLRAALGLWQALRRGGLSQVVVCPGSRSAPLAVAASLLEPAGLVVHTALDERSAAFFALGLGRALGVPAAVVTTSGSAVAQLLPACVEADHGTIPLLLLSADRPARLKGCGANQSVNQEDFLRASCRAFFQGDGAGLAVMEPQALQHLAQQCLLHCTGRLGGPPPGAVHLNLPLEEPLHGDGPALTALAAELAQALAAEAAAPLPCSLAPAVALGPAGPLPGAPGLAATLALDPDRPGVVVAGPWRGLPQRWSEYRAALLRWQRCSGWPVLADGLSGLRGDPELALVAGYDLLLEAPPASLAPPQVLRLGSLPASRRLERWLAGLAAHQVLVSEGDPRPLDPLGRCLGQDPGGLAAWLAALVSSRGEGLAGDPAPANLALAEAWHQAEAAVQAGLERHLEGAPQAGAAWSEPALARALARLLPAGLPLMLANSSPVRDWESFAADRGPADRGPAGLGPARPVLGFRGASGIDGTLSEACGLAEGLGACVLLSGDLALLHDSNGWLWRPQLRGRLTVVLIDNGGGGIFEQLPIRCPPQAGLDFERLFAMPQPVDPLALAALHGVPAREVAAPADLPAQLAWALEQPISLLVVRTDRRRDAALRQRLRTMACQPARP